METPMVKAEVNDALFISDPVLENKSITQHDPILHNQNSTLQSFVGIPLENSPSGPIQNGLESESMTNEFIPSMKKPISSAKTQVTETRIDFPSIKGVFGWTTLNNVNIPYIFRKDRKFVSVRIVEQKLLSKYPNSYPDELGKHQPLTSYFITEHEANLLNEINQIHCGGEFGSKAFNCKDLIVLLEDFSDFYNLVKKTFPLPENSKKQPIENKSCGWIQVNNTVTPFLWKTDGKYVPLLVMKYAANLNIQEKGLLPTAEECESLTQACVSAGFNFTFSKTTRLVSLDNVISKFPVHIIELPSSNPLENAQYLESSGQAAPPVTTMMPHEQGSYEYVPQMNEKTLQQLPPDIRNRFMTPKQRMMNPSGQNIQSKFMDDKMMFSFNRFPFTKYNLPYHGPPNVTVNPGSISSDFLQRMPQMSVQGNSYPSHSSHCNITPSNINTQFSSTATGMGLIPQKRMTVPQNVAVSQRITTVPSMMRMSTIPAKDAIYVSSDSSQSPSKVKTNKTVIPPPPHMSGPHVMNYVVNRTQPLGAHEQSGKNKDRGITDGNKQRNMSPSPSVVSQNESNSSNDLCEDQELTRFAESIKGLWLAGKSISCMHVDSTTRKGRFCLVEAVCKLYFSGCSVTEFLFALETLLKISLVTCSDKEEKAFIKYYSLPVSVLKCNKMIEFDDLEKYFPQLSYLFKNKSKKLDKILNNDPKSDNLLPQQITETNLNEEDSSTSSDWKENKPEKITNSNFPTSQVNVMKPVGSLKRKMPSSFLSSKQPSKRLEATVQRLMNQQGVTSAAAEPQNCAVESPGTPEQSTSSFQETQSSALEVQTNILEEQTTQSETDVLEESGLHTEEEQVITGVENKTVSDPP